MPKVPIDWSQTVLYKITAPDGSYFVNYTTNLVQRKSSLKKASVSGSMATNDVEINFLKAKGFENCTIEPVKIVSVANSTEATIEVGKYKAELTALLPPPVLKAKASRPKKIVAFKPEPVPEPVVEPVVEPTPAPVPVPEPEPVILQAPPPTFTVGKKSRKKSA